MGVNHSSVKFLAGTTPDICNMQVSEEGTCPNVRFTVVNQREGEGASKLGWYMSILYRKAGALPN